MARSRKDQNIELGADTPQLEKITSELEQGQSDANFFYRRMLDMREWWYSRWPGQTIDGRKHPGADRDEEDCFPWIGSADSRVRTVSTLIREHVMMSKFAFFKAKIQATTPRPMIHGGEVNKATKLLRWRLYNHMWSELIRELPLVFNWWWGYGLGLLSIQWEQSRRLEYQPITVPDLADILGMTDGGQTAHRAVATGMATGMATGAGGDPLLSLQSALYDGAQEDALTTVIQGLSPVVSRPQARKIIQDLRHLRFAEIPVAYPYKNKPLWTALKPCVDALWPSETSDIQEGRWFADTHEWLSETELTDRIETDGYDPEFVELAIKQKGEPAIANSRAWFGAPYLGEGSRRDLINIVSFYYRASMEGVPVMLKTVFSPMVKKDRDPLYAKHGPFEYAHGQYPVVTFARRTEDRRLLYCVGIAEEAYTDEYAIKAQLDGLTDRTSLVNRPAMIVPQNKVAKIQGSFRPGAILGVGREREIGWPPLPPSDSTPVAVMQTVQQMLDRRYPLFGAELDPELKQIYRDEVANDTLAVATLAIDQTWQLMQEFELEDEVAEVAGQLQRPFPVSPAEIRGKHEISATVDTKMLVEDYAQAKMGLIGQAQAFKQDGVLFDIAMETLEPDVAELLKQNQVSPAAMEKEKQDERNAIAQAFAGIEAPLPQYGNHQLRMQTLQEAFQNNPMMMQRLRMLPDTQKILQNRMKFFQNQIKQYTQNPQIGRALATRTFQRGMAPELQQST